MESSLKRFLLEFEKNPRICSILYDGRSGSVFLQSLLDDHPDVSTFPATALMGGARGRHINEMLAMVPEMSWVALGEEFVRRYPVVFDSTDDTTNCRLNELGENQNEKIDVCRKKFLEIWNELTASAPKTPRIFFIALHLAYEAAKNRKITGRFLIVHAMHTPEPNMKMVCDLFPEQKILLMTREPLETFASHFTHHIKVYEKENPGKKFWEQESHASYPFHIFKNIFSSYEEIKKNVKQHKNIRAIRLEDLHISAKKTTGRIQKFLKIKPSEKILKATFSGKIHWGDISIPHKTGASKKRPTFDSNKLYFEEDKILLKSLLAKRYFNYKYQRNDKNKKQKDINTLLENPNKWEALGLSILLNIEIEAARTALKSGNAASIIHNMPWRKKIFLGKKKKNIVNEITKHFLMRVKFSKKLQEKAKKEIKIPLV